MSKLLLVIVVSFCFAPLAQAWNALGHMVVSQIAYGYLTPTAKAACDALIAVPLAYGGPSNNTFVTAAAWADDHRNQLGNATSHYINLPFTLDETLTNSFVPPAFDVVQAINQSIAVLQNPASSLTNRATHLRYLIHFVGDIQQPLHCVTYFSSGTPNGDAGGNGFTLTGGDWSNLHALWDSGGGYLTNFVARPIVSAGQAILNTKMTDALNNYPYTPNPDMIPNPMTWAQEGLDLAKTNTYVGVTRNTTPSGTYLTKVRATAEQRVLVGGRRLADLLNTLFSPGPVSLTPLPMLDGQFGFTWPAISNATYRVEWKANLADPLWNEQTNFVASSNWVSFSVTNQPAQRFYRVVQ